MTYQEYLKTKQGEVDALPMFFAFNNEQFEQELAKRGVTMETAGKIYRLPYGGFCLERDADVIRAYFNREDPLPKLMEDPDFAEDAFYYEMCNHEYGINWQGDWDVCRCFGDVDYDDTNDGLDYLNQMGYNEDVKKAYLRAERRYNQDALDNDWF